MRLAELQRRIVARLYGEPADLGDAIRGDGPVSADERLGIYRNNLRAGFGKALALEFPVIAALCGAEYFETLAREFQQAHPSVSGDLHHIGGPFPQFLRGRLGDGDYAYFAAVAALERAREEAARAADTAPFALETLRGIAPDAVHALRFVVHPAVRLVASRWPILAIWEAHQGPGDVPHVNLGAGGQQVLVRRSASGLVLERIAPGDFGLLTALLRGDTLGEALDAALLADPGFDVGAALQRLVTRGVFASVLS